MNNRILIKPRTGRFAGQGVFTDRDGYGVFTKRLDGSDLQHTGTGQTPQFRTAKQFARWLRKNYSV